MTDQPTEIPELPIERSFDRLVSLLEPISRIIQPRQTILVFPGGSREVNKRRGQQYQLLWRERIGFARLAIEQGYPVTPFAGPTPVPRPERLYFWFGDPIHSTRFGSRFDDVAEARELRDEVKRAIILGSQFLRDERDQDPHRSLLARLLRAGAPRDPRGPRMSPRDLDHHRPGT